MNGLIAQSLRRAAQIRGSSVAFECERRAIDWSTLLERANRLSSGLDQLGYRRGDRLAMLLPNGLTGVELFAAAALSGIVIVPLNFRWTVDELVDGLRDSGAKALVIDDCFRESGGQAAIRAGINLIDAGRGGEPMALTYEAVFGAEGSQAANSQADDLLAIFYTGGTTSRSKGVMLSHGNIGYVAMAGMAEGFYGQGQVYLHASPAFHIAGAMNIFQAFVTGCRNIILPRFESGAALDAIATAGVTQSLLVPTMISMLLDHPDFETADTSSVRQILYGAAPMPQALLKRAMTSFPQARFTQLYGMTETASNACILHDPTWGAANENNGVGHSVGQAMVGSEIGIVGPDGGHLLTGELGEIVIRSPGVMLGYWNNPRATQQVIRDGWMRTGDGGYMDANGFVYLTDRIKDVVISGGENVYSLEVENVLVQHPAVGQCAVIGVPHSVWGEAVHAVVVLHAGRTCTDVSLIEFCRERLAAFKVPRSIEFRSALPLTAAGKVLKRDLRAPFWETARTA